MDFTKNPNTTGMFNPDGSVLRTLFVEHTISASEPAWLLSSDQNADIKINHMEAIRVCVTEHPEWSSRSIAEHVGCCKTVVNKWLKEIKCERTTK